MRMLKKWVTMQGRILVVRIKSQWVDVILFAAYAPGDHLVRELRGKFWKQLDSTVRAAPRRTTRIMGIDANGHVGRDGGAGIGEQGAER